MKRVEKYKAQGFVEALIAITVTGIAAIALLSVATGTLRRLAETERADQLAQDARQGGEFLSQEVDEFNNSDSADNFFTNYDSALDNSKCFPLIEDISNVEAGLDNTMLDSPINNCTYSNSANNSGIEPTACISGGVYLSAGQTSLEVTSDRTQENSADDVFRIFCIHPESTQNTLIAKIITGTNSCEDVSQRISVNSNQSVCDFYEYTQIHLLLGD